MLASWDKYICAELRRHCPMFVTWRLVGMMMRENLVTSTLSRLKLSSAPVSLLAGAGLDWGGIWSAKYVTEQAFKTKITTILGAKDWHPRQWRAENTRCWSGPRPGWTRGRGSPGAWPLHQRCSPPASPGQSPRGWGWRMRDLVMVCWDPFHWDIQRGCSLETWTNSFWQLYSLQIFGANLQKQCAAKLLNKLPNEQLHIYSIVGWRKEKLISCSSFQKQFPDSKPLRHVSCSFTRFGRSEL